MSKIHRYEASIHWGGSTGGGWDAYAREHQAKAPPAEPELTLTTGESHGDPAHLNPEQLVVMAASSCQMLWFLHLAAKARVDVIDYRDEATGEMPETREPMSLKRITLRPRITVSPGTDSDRVLRLVERAHDHCYVANSLRSEVVIEPRVELSS
jgi:organic hydroperoxide reductase OsmC/OhrA